MKSGKFLESLFDQQFNNAALSKYDAVSKSFICSFPRSGNGWVRSLMVAGLLHDAGFPAEHLSRSSVEKGGVRYSALAFKDIVFEVDGFIPDIYALNKNIECISDYSEKYNNVGRLVKTHHVLGGNTGKDILLVREPLMCVPSAMLLLCSNNESAQSEAYLKFVAEQYNKFLDWHSERRDTCELDFFVLDHATLVNDTGVVLRQVFDYANISISEEAIDAATKVFPFLSNPAPKQAMLEQSPDAAEFIRAECMKSYYRVIGKEMDGVVKS